MPKKSLAARACRLAVPFWTASLVATLALLATPACAGKGAFLPTYHAPPCAGSECRGDDPRSGLPCQGFLCSVTSAGALQPPVTAAQAAELEKARAAAATAAAAEPMPMAAPVKKKMRSRAPKLPMAPAAAAGATTPTRSAKPDKP